MTHSARFLRLVNETRPNIPEITVDEAKDRLVRNPAARLIDIREDDEWRAGHAANAQHLGKGVLERDIERLVPDPGTELLLYCGGGYRSVLAAEVAQRMGYTRVYSIIGGYKSMVVEGWPVASG
jgi:rhodanese-related sulfurtransferase